MAGKRLAGDVSGAARLRGADAFQGGGVGARLVVVELYSRYSTGVGA